MPPEGGHHESSIQTALARRLQTVDVVTDLSEAAGYDAVIVVTPPRLFSNTSESSPDASGTAISNTYLRKMNYQVLKSGSRIASGAVNVDLPVSPGPGAYESLDYAANVNAAQVMADDVARKLSRS